ncbi:MAG TPA: type III PLP-dependent enzyme [Acidimicrobiales bacterium]|jgi:ornithine decarboxylase|nr:type III PLP-dependent enzyme [Acidimicrobiales bacterium]
MATAESTRAPGLTRAIQTFLDGEPRPTPFLVIDLDVVSERYDSLAAALPEADIFYAVKANPDPDVLRTLLARGCRFDVASVGEIDLCTSIGATGEQMSFGNTIKKVDAIRHAYEAGIRLFAFDAMSELEKLDRLAPDATVFCRVLCDGSGADWPLSRKFGCAPDLAVDLLFAAAASGHPVGVSFHVGSQQRDVGAWDRALAMVADLFAALRGCDIEPAVVNIGGGFPGTYLEPAPAIEEYGAAIRRALARRFGTHLPRLIAEPGRYMVADAGVVETEVVSVTKKARFDEQRWVFLDVGTYGGLAEAAGEALRYRFVTPRAHDTAGPVVIAGPTCDSVDILYEQTTYQFPLSLEAGDRIQILGAGAYTTTCSSVGFNGFPPLAAYVVGGDR